MARAVLLALLLVGAEAAAQPPPALSAARVLAHVRSVSNATLIPRYCDASSPKVKWDVGHAELWAECAALQAQLFVHSDDRAGDARLAAGAVADLRQLVAQLNATKTADFFTAPALMLAYNALERAEALPAEDASAVRGYALKTFKPEAPASNNQHYQRAVGLGLAAQAFPSAPQAAAWMKYAADVWALVEALGDITEDAPNYNRIDLTYLWLLADMLGKTDQLRAPSFHAAYRRFAAQVSPSGVLPAYGDSGGARRTTAANFSDVPWANPWGGFVTGFLRAASEWQDKDDGLLASTAASMFASGVSRQPLGGAYNDVSQAFRLAIGVEWSERQRSSSSSSSSSQQQPPLLRQPAAAPAVKSAVLTRPDANGPHAFDKVVLRSSSKPDNATAAAGGGGGGAFLLSDLYGSAVPVPPHAHENQHGQVNWFEYAGVPLISSLGYDNRGPADTNLLLLRKAGSTFPHRIPKFGADTWEHATLPTRRMGSGRVTISELTLRIEWDGKPITFSAAELYLRGPSGSRALNLFEETTTWQYPKGATVVQQHVSLPPGPNGTMRNNVSALAWSLPAGKSGQAGAAFISTKLQQPLVFETAATEFPEIHIDWRISSNSDVTRTFILRVASSPNAVDYHASELNLAPTLRSAKVETSADGDGDDSFAHLGYTSWFSYDVALNRSMVLAGPEGALLVKDVLDVGATNAQGEAGMQAGPIWHFGPVAQPVLGSDSVSRSSSSDGGGGGSGGGGSNKWVLSQNASVNVCVVFSYRYDSLPSGGAPSAADAPSAGEVTSASASSDLHVG